MKKRIFTILLMILLALLVTYGEYTYLKRQVAPVTMVEVYFVKNFIPKGEIIVQKDLKQKKIPVDELEEGYIDTLDTIAGQYAVEDLYAGSILQKLCGQPSKELSLVESASNILVTFEFDGATANGWNLRRGQVVELLYCPREESEQLEVFENVIVVEIYDKTVDPTGSDGKAQNKYVTFEIEKKKGYQLLSKRHEGRVEIIIL